MKKLKIAMLSILSLLAIIGLVYGAMTTQFMADKSLDKVSIEVTKTATRDFERNIFVVETDTQSEILYSVVQGKNLRATTTGLEPGYILAKRGDTRNFSPLYFCKTREEKHSAPIFDSPCAELEATRYW